MTTVRRDALSPQALSELAGSRLGTSPWMDISQGTIDAFAEITGDAQFIHVDPVRTRAETELDGTIAHGFLTLALLSVMAETGLPAFADLRRTINYGFDRLRFLAPVPSGSRVRGHFDLYRVEPRSVEQLLLHLDVSIEVENRAQPAMVARWLTLLILNSPQGAV